MSPELPGFTLEERVGEGSGGVVWRGRAADGAVVAIKIAVADTLTHEIAVLARAQRRWGPALVAHGVVGGRAWMASTWAEGTALPGRSGSARDSSRDAAPARDSGRDSVLRDEAAAIVAHAVARGLDELHRAGFRHGDVKPANILVNGRRPRVDRASERGATLVDLDLAAAVDVGALVGGTPAYLPPEASGSGVGSGSGSGSGEMSPAADLYALGLVLKEMGPSGVPALWVEALLARSPGARPSAGFIAEQAARFLGLERDDEEVIAERRARVRRTYLALRPSAVGERTVGERAVGERAVGERAVGDIDGSIVAAPRAWLESVNAGARPLTRLETARWIVALVGADAAHWTMPVHEGESVLAGRFLDLAALAPPEAWTREEIAGTARGTRAQRGSAHARSSASGPALWVELAAALGAPRPEEDVLARVEEELAAAARRGEGAVGAVPNTARIQDPAFSSANLNSGNNAGDDPVPGASGSGAADGRAREGAGVSGAGGADARTREGVSGAGAADGRMREGAGAGGADARMREGVPAALATELAAALVRRGAIGRAFAAVAYARDEESTLLRAEIARRRGDMEGAAGYAEAALAAPVTRERAHALLARLAWDRGDLARAETEAAAASGAAAAEVRALIAYAKGEHVRGLALLADVDASGLARARIDGTRGMLEHARGDARASVEAFQRAVDRATEAGAVIEEATYLTGLSAAAVDAGATASALASSTRAALLWERLGREAMAARAHMNRAAAFALVGAAHEATEAAAEVLRRNDARARSYARWAVVESRQPGDATAAEQALLAYAELADADPEDAVRALARVLVYAPAAVAPQPASAASPIPARIQDPPVFPPNLNSGNVPSPGEPPAPAPVAAPAHPREEAALAREGDAAPAHPREGAALAREGDTTPAHPSEEAARAQRGDTTPAHPREEAVLARRGDAAPAHPREGAALAREGDATLALARYGDATHPREGAPSAVTFPDLAAVDARVNAMAAATRWEWWGARAATGSLPRFVAEIVALLDVPAPIGSRGPALAAAVKLARALGDGEAARRIEAVRRSAATTLREGAPAEQRAALASVSWLEGIADDDERTALGAGQVGELEAIVRALSSRDRLKPLLEQVLDTMVLWTGVERGLLLLRAPDGRLVPRAARNLARRDLGHEQLSLSTGLAQRAIAERRTVLATDAFAQVGDLHASVHALGLRSVLAVPLVARGDVLGVVYLDDRVRRNAFGPGELAWVRLVASQAALAIADARDQALLRRAVRRAERANARLAAELGQREVELATARAETRFRYDDIIGRSEPMRSMLKLVDRVTMSDVPVLLVGESGTGKELVARAIHANGLRSTKPFVSENCGSVPETLLESTLFGHVRGAFTGASATRAGLFDVADRGSLFLDEIGEMPLAMQTKLLRVLQNGEVRPVGGERSRTVDVRIIGATHRDLDAMVAAGTFREDLFYRLNVVSIRIPPLRERREDIPLLANRFVTQHAEPGRKVKLTRAAIDRLAAFPWPGNVRQLENEIRRALVLADDRIDVTELSDEVAKGGPSATRDAGVGLKARIDALETDLVKDALLKTKGNQTRAAELLGISRFGLQKMMKRLGIRSP